MQHGKYTDSKPIYKLMMFSPRSHKVCLQTQQAYSKICYVKVQDFEELSS